MITQPSKKQRKQNEKQVRRPCQKTKKLWNMNVTVISIINGAFGTDPKGLISGLEELEIGRRAEIIQATALLRSAGILSRVLEI